MLQRRKQKPREIGMVLPQQMAHLAPQTQGGDFFPPDQVTAIMGVVFKTPSCLHFTLYLETTVLTCTRTHTCTGVSSSKQKHS